MMRPRHILLLAALLAPWLLPDAALAASAGGSMPYSAFLTQVRASLSGEVALTIALICFSVGFALWLVGQDLHGPMLFVARGGVICSIMLGALTFLTSLGVGGAVVA